MLHTSKTIFQCWSYKTHHHIINSVHWLLICHLSCLSLKPVTQNTHFSFTLVEDKRGCVLHLLNPVTSTLILQLRHSIFHLNYYVNYIWIFKTNLGTGLAHRQQCQHPSIQSTPLCEVSIFGVPGHRSWEGSTNDDRICARWQESCSWSNCQSFCGLCGICKNKQIYICKVPIEHKKWLNLFIGCELF